MSELASEQADEPVLLPESQPVKSAAPEPATAPAIYMPPTLAWLQEVTPFAEPLKFIVDKVRGAKSTVNFTLGESLRRQTDLRNQREAIDEKLRQEAVVEEEQRQKLTQLDTMISACELMAEQSKSVDAELLTPHPAKKHHESGKAGNGTTAANGSPRGPYVTRRWLADAASTCRQEDVLNFFAANVGTNWSAGEIREQLPAGKRAHAKTYLNVILATLAKDGRLQRVTQGVYRAAQTQ